MIRVAFFNARGGVGATAEVAHLAWMAADQGIPTIAVDLDPQSNLSAMMLSEERLTELWIEKKTLRAAIQPLVARIGDVAPSHAEPIATNLHLLTGDLGLSRFEDLLAETWNRCLTGEEGAFRVISAFHRIMAEAASRQGAELVLIDLGPNLGPLNRAALLAADHLVLPVAPDLFSLQGMENLGPTLREWRRGWEKRRGELDREAADLDLPAGAMKALGYVVMSFGVRDSRPVAAYDHWLAKIPSTFREAVLGEPASPATPPPSADADPYCLAALKHYRSLMPLAMTARKPMFMLKNADGARGAHLDAVRACYHDFHRLARRIGALVDLPIP